MRVLFLLLLLANLAFFAWTQFYAPQHPSADARPLAQQIQPEKLPILSSAQIVPTPPPKPTVEPRPSACLEWGSFTAADASRAERLLEPLALGDRLGRRRGEEKASWWVFIAPQQNRPAAQKKVGELKALGIDEWFIVPDEGSWRWSISLGVFRTEAAAKTHLEALTSRGVRSAQYGARDTQVEKTWLQVRNVDAALAGRLREVAAGMEGSELRECN